MYNKYLKRASYLIQALLNQILNSHVKMLIRR